MQVIVSSIKEVLDDTWPMIALTSVVLIIIRLAYLFKNKEELIISKELMMLTFIVYILCLFQIVTSNDVSGTHGINLTLFKEMTRYHVGTRLFYRNIIGNILMFIPFGFFTSYYLKLERKSFVFFLSVIVAVVIELIQLRIGRAFDIDDILLNVVGSMIGYFLYRIIDRIFGKLSDTLKGTLIIIIILTTLVILTFII